MRMADKDIDDEVQAAMQVAQNVGADPVADFARLHRVRRPSKRTEYPHFLYSPIFQVYRSIVQYIDESL